VQYGTAARRAPRYTSDMSSKNAKPLIFVAWAATVSLVALAMGITSVPHWLVVACVAIVPPTVAWSFWRAPEQSISESINKARR
jgi:hypothetical protein